MSLKTLRNCIAPQPMNARERHINTITEALTYLRTKVELRNSIDLYDVNSHAENFYRDLFNLVFDWGLENMNLQTRNAAHVDLVDESNKKAIQVTSQNDGGKISDSVKGFFSKAENADYELKVLLIAKTPKAYRTDFTFDGKFKFDAEKDIYDIETLLGIIKNKKTEELEKIADFLAKETAGISVMRAEASEVATIMALIEYLSEDDNAKEEDDRLGEVDPERKLHRFEEHADFLGDLYGELYSVYFSTLTVAKETVGLDGIRARKIALYLKSESDKILNKNNNDPRKALDELVDYFERKVTSNGRSCDKVAIQFYLLNELIACNVFPNPKLENNAVK